ncbi:ribosomal-processing cysteine protease Prp [Halalkalibacillus halophilus]|uniref:ribosomal-processing cysteine protease Prp n=1 Tax=Halalkalibacillus halophilus TaxID=392827 RepID=UPI0004181FA3|nr:ribosomal-processing cysteine protease Prp [Halalkalibacillus halophilus]
MIEMIVFKNEDDTIRGFQLSGHADSGPQGHDLVCAAVSAVSFGAVNAIISIVGCTPDIEQGDEGGFLKMNLPEGLTGVAFQKAQTLLMGMIVTFETIENDYSEYITISRT